MNRIGSFFIPTQSFPTDVTSPLPIQLSGPDPAEPSTYSPSPQAGSEAEKQTHEER
jgi:hypothetical protein